MSKTAPQQLAEIKNKRKETGQKVKDATRELLIKVGEQEFDLFEDIEEYDCEVYEKAVNVIREYVNQSRKRVLNKR